jgi:hypothetical protein
MDKRLKLVSITLFLLLIILIFTFLNHGKDDSSEKKLSEEEMFKKLMDDFRKIFPDRNRNSGGVQFYNYILNEMEPTIEEFKLLNTFYCGVSGSPIDPKRKNRTEYIIVDGVDGKKYYGKYHLCCWPCLCDIMKYVKVEEHIVELKDGEYKHMVLTINDPCSNTEKIPKQVTSFSCENSKTKNGEHANSGRLIIGILYETEVYNKEIHNVDNILSRCEERMNTDPDDLKGGMGDIFVKLSLVSDR